LAHIIDGLSAVPGIGLDDDLASVGDDADTAAAAAVRVRSWLDVPTITAADVLAARTVRGLADLLRQRDARVEQVAELFLEVAAVDAAEVGFAVTPRQTPPDFAPWIRRYAGSSDRADGAIVLFPHAGSAAAAYRRVATAFAAHGPNVFVVQYPQHAGRLSDPAAPTVAALAADLFAAGPWENVAPVALFGHCMGSLVAFEFARLAAHHGVDISRLWVSGGAAPSAMADLLPLPTADDEILADLTQLGGTDPRLLEDPEFVELLVPAIRADYQALNRYTSAPGDAVDVDIAVIGADRDDRVTIDALKQWEAHTGRRFDLHLINGGHFFLFENLDEVTRIVSSHA
jgi:mycobactin phenyloxazoline synthetase